MSKSCLLCGKSREVADRRSVDGVSSSAKNLHGTVSLSELQPCPFAATQSTRTEEEEEEFVNIHRHYSAYRKKYHSPHGHYGDLDSPRKTSWI